MLASALIVAAAGAACSSDATLPTVPAPGTSITSEAPPQPPPNTTVAAAGTAPPATTGTAGVAECPSFSEPTSQASIQDPNLTEISGLVVGRAAPNLVWVHNDSGDGAAVYGIGPDGETKSIVTLRNVFALDWEDMDIGPGPDGTTSYLYVADIGDNLTFRPSVIIHRFREPDGTNPKIIVGAESLVLTYPGGPKDAEALFIDPQAQQLVIVTKQDARIYTAPISAFEDGRADLVGAGRLADPIGLVTAASTDALGAWIAIRTPQRVLLWSRSPSRSVAETLAVAPCELPAPAERQGEALGLSADGAGYVTIAEGNGSAIMMSHRE